MKSLALVNKRYHIKKSTAPVRDQINSKKTCPQFAKSCSIFTKWCTRLSGA